MEAMVCIAIITVDIVIIKVDIVIIMQKDIIMGPAVAGLFLLKELKNSCFTDFNYYWKL